MLPQRNTTKTDILKVSRGQVAPASDVLAAEEPMEIRLAWQEDDRPVEQSISITMRTPGNDFELAAGFLFTEGVVPGRYAIADINYCMDAPSEQQFNVVSVVLKPGVTFDSSKLLRHFYTNSSCGVCGKASLESLRVLGCSPLTADEFAVNEETLYQLPQRLRQAQQVFQRTGGLHAAALFDREGNLVGLHEDVGRHNAVDKLIGEQLLADQLPLSDRMMMVSGRASFELVQKALVARVPFLAAVGAPSSLALDLAREFGMTLVGFLRGDSFNVYACEHRIISSGSHLSAVP
ncbi:MAG: formate dehydrogenase accessory sulfurtransferase FdhD [Chloroflexi bacterium]|nr:formate dehydrogenase accessory sulfurtransferase FdhD [Chloroflexota bacterium]